MFLFLMTSCDQKNAGEQYTFANEGVTFLASRSSIMAQPSETTATFKIVRGNLNGRLELPVTASYDQDIFTIPSTVVFEDGAGEASLSIPLDKTILGVTYSIALSFDSIRSSLFGYFKTTLSIMRDYNWVSAGVAEMYSSWAGNSEGIDVKIEYADGTNPGRYRLVSPYYALEPAYASAGSHLVFELDANHNALNFPDQQKIGELYDGTYDIYIFSSEDGDTFTNDGNKFTILGSFYVSIGGWGQMPEVFIWKDGYPGDE
jgi:hypothetical protein